MNTVKIDREHVAALVAAWKVVSNDAAYRLVREWEGKPGTKFVSGRHRLEYRDSQWLLKSQDATASLAILVSVARMTNVPVLY